tara:strand:- start:135 stop:620 length:486 start_codon:yes stop_codon:yes gene_type:complete
MRNSTNGVDIQGMGNTVDLKTVLTLYSSSFTEGFIKVFDNYNTPLQEFIEVKNEVTPMKKTVTKRKPSNKGFEKLKNELLRENLQKGERIQFNPELHIKVCDLKYKSIYDLDSLGKKRWEGYFSKGKVYIDKDVTTSKISKRILFDKSVTEFFGKTETSTK